MKKVLTKVLTVVLALPAIFFVVSGVQWLVDPASAAATLGMSLDAGIGRSSQIGDIAAFFLVTGLMVAIGLVTGRRSWFYAPVLLLSLAAIGRTIAWVLHDAELAVPMIVFELVNAGLLWFGSARVCQQEEV